MEIRFTAKQIEILRIIHAANEDGTLCSVYDIQQKLSYPVKRDALSHSIRILVEAGYLEKKAKERREKRLVRVYAVTTKAADIF